MTDAVPMASSSGVNQLMVCPLAQYRSCGTLGFPITLLDLSEERVAGIALGPLSLGAVVELDIYFVSDRELTISAQVTWLKLIEASNGERGYRVEFRIVSLSQEARKRLRACRQEQCQVEKSDGQRGTLGSLPL